MYLVWFRKRMGYLYELEIVISLFDRYSARKQKSETLVDQTYPGKQGCYEYRTTVQLNLGF